MSPDQYHHEKQKERMRSDMAHQSESKPDTLTRVLADKRAADEATKIAREITAETYSMTGTWDEARKERVAVITKWLEAQETQSA